MPDGVTCMACRLSKVKCVRLDEAPACVRCSRLGLICASSGVKKRGAANVKRDVARLGPAVRALLAAQEGAAGVDGPYPTAALASSSYGYDTAPVEWCGPHCPAMVMSSIHSNAGRLALLQHWMLIALRSGSCAVLGNVLLLAHMGGLSLDCVKALTRDSAESPSVSSVPSPPFIAEWQALDSPVFTRAQVNGRIEFLPNRAFETNVGNLSHLVHR